MATLSKREIPALPVDKEYHIFVCYPGENISEVHLIVENLEKHGLKCCYHERDFTPGSRVLENIHETMSKSMHMLVILSEDFMNRGFCKHEVIQALHAKINEEYSIIPIKIEPCSVPEFLKHITYIDAEEVAPDEMHSLILDAVLKQDSSPHQYGGKNGHILKFQLTKHQPKWWYLPRYKFVLDHSDRHELWQQQFQECQNKHGNAIVQFYMQKAMGACTVRTDCLSKHVEIVQFLDDKTTLSVDQLDEIEGIVSNSTLVKYAHILKYFKRVTTIVFVITLYLCSILCGIYIAASFGHTYLESEPDISLIFSLIPYLLILFVLLWSLCICMDCSRLSSWRGITHGVRIRAAERLTEDLWTINKHAKSLKLIVFFNVSEEGLFSFLKIMRYDFRACETYFIRRCERKDSLQKMRKENESLEVSSKEMKKAIAKMYGGYLSRHSVMSRQGVVSRYASNVSNVNIHWLWDLHNAKSTAD